MSKRFLATASLGLALVAGACGGSHAAGPDPDPGSEAAPHAEETHDAHTPAIEIPGAQLVTGHFEGLSTAPAGYERIGGHAWLARHDGGTTVTIEIVGLQPDESFISHLHAGSCAESGGPHYQFEANGGTMPPNEIHLMFTSDEDGSAFLSVEHERVAGPAATSLVVHSAATMEPKVACADLG